MVRNDAEVVFQQLKELDMIGKGWIWIGSDKSTTSVFDDATNLQDAMQGVIGIHPSRKSLRLFFCVRNDDFCFKSPIAKPCHFRFVFARLVFCVEKLYLSYNC